MPSFAQRSYQPELLDGKQIPFEDIRQNMRELEVINSRLGGHAITIHGLKSLLENPEITFSKNDPLVIAEIGCGGGDNLKAIHRWCEKKRIPARLIGIDINPECISYARNNCSALPNSQFIVSDYKELVWAARPHIIFSSLFCHHFQNQELEFQLRWMREHAGVGFFINDLHRHPLAYYSIKILTGFFSRSYLVKNDAPLSVLRGFKRAEWIQLLKSAEIHKFELEWKWAFRWLISARR